MSRYFTADSSTTRNPEMRCQASRFRGGRCVQTGRLVGEVVVCGCHEERHVPVDGLYWAGRGRWAK